MQRFSLARISLVITLLLSSSLVFVQPATPAQAAVGDHGAAFSGERPATNPGDFDLSSAIEVPNSTELNTLGRLTIEAWVYRNATLRTETILGNGRNTSYWLGFSSTGKLQFTPRGTANIVSSQATVSAGRWTHVAVTLSNAGKALFYINGQLDSSADTLSVASSPTPRLLGIGVDLTDDFAPNYFGGLLDTVRVWDVVRTTNAIRTGLFQVYDAATPNLVAEWRLDGNASDTTGNHSGTNRGAGFGNAGGLPRDIRVQQASGTPPSVDGACGAAEYSGATPVTLHGAAALLLRTANDLFVCVDGLDGATAQLYLDRDFDRAAAPQPDDLRLSISPDDARTTSIGTGSAFTPTTEFDTQWEADYRSCCGEFPTDRAEFRLSLQLLGNATFGLALGRRTGIIVAPRMWPALATPSQPATWSALTLGSLGPPRTITGQVRYKQLNGAALTVGAARLLLIGSDSGGSEALLDSVETSDTNGNFSLTTSTDFPSLRLELDRSTLPRGMQPQSVQAPAQGSVLDPRTVLYSSLPAGSYGGTVFTLADLAPAPTDSANGPLLLIFAPNVVADGGVLDAFVDWKRRLGFAVEVVTLESLGAPLGSTALRDAVRATEQQRKATYGDRFRYVLLVGGDTVIPFMAFTPVFVGKNSDGNTDLDACNAPIATTNTNANGIKIKIADWYYADLVSNFDTNNNGCLGDGLRSDLADWAPGYIADAKPQFQASVAVGRLPFAQPDDVRTVLANIVGFERQSDDFKRKTLLATSYAFLKGRFWDIASGEYLNCPPTTAQKEANGSSKDCKSATTDGAFLGERLRNDFLDDQGYDVKRYYEQKKVEGASSAVSPIPLAENNLIAELQDGNHGLVNLAGHGSAKGVSRTFWNDINNNGKLESPDSTGNQELEHATLLRRDTLDYATPDNSRGSIYIAAACSTGDPTDPDNFGAQLMREGDGVAWVGGLSMVNVGPWKKPSDGNIMSVNYYVVERLLKRNLRLGEAVWEALAQKTNSSIWDGSADAATALYGDPTLSYWGNPGGQASLAPWPMLRQNNLGQGFTTLSGPGAPKELFLGTFSPPLAESALPPSPILGHGGEIIMTYDNSVQVRTLEPSPFQSLPLDAPAYGTPALSADGTIYVLDTIGQLYAFDRLRTLGEGPGQRTLRWKLNLPLATGAFTAQPTTGPTIGPDGFIYLSLGDNIAAVRPDGRLFSAIDIAGTPIGALAVDANRRVYVTTSLGTRYRCEFFNPLLSSLFSGVCVQSGSFSPQAFYTTAPLLAHGAVYAGRLDGVVQKLSADTLNQQASFQADGLITAGPVAGPAGIVFGTSKGTLYSLNASLGLRWQRSTGATALRSVPASSGDAVYVVAGGLLRAYNPQSGAPLWSRELGQGVESGSAAVGFGRRVVVRTNVSLAAFGEDWPAAPTGLTLAHYDLSQRVQGIAVSWAFEQQGAGVLQASDTPGILLQRSANGDSWEDLALLPAGTTAYSDSTVRDDTSYRYRVQVLGDGEPSEFTSGEAPLQSLPALPAVPTISGVVATAADALRLTWSEPAGALVKGYRVERGSSAAGPFVPVATSSVTTSVDSGLLAGTSYFYRLVALNASGESAPSAVVSGITRQRGLAAPQELSVQIQQDGGLRLSWSGALPAAAAFIELADGTLDGFLPLANVAAGGPYIAYVGEPSVYQFRVKFVAGENESPYALSGPIEIREPRLANLPLVAR